MNSSRLRAILPRIYDNFLMPSKLDSYSELLGSALRAGYETHSVASFWDVIAGGGPSPVAKYMVVRHDIDTDPATAACFLEIEARLAVRASYYFRLSTLDLPLMERIAEVGSEASFHYEEIATISKERCLKTKDQVYAEMPRIRNRFKSNLHALRQATGLPMSTVSSHGDFVNRQLGLANWELLRDRAFRAEVDIKLEAYDEAMMRHVRKRFTDIYDDPSGVTLLPQAIRASEPVLYLLTHPRMWRSNPGVNLRDDLGRVWAGVRYRICG
ncbi:MAG: hypothetical protein M3T56_13240 [Chloroflexota bacterium]|nr:hypothetical protein [Chloroflexota bacterium]